MPFLSHETVFEVKNSFWWKLLDHQTSRKGYIRNQTPYLVAFPVAYRTARFRYFVGNFGADIPVTIAVCRETHDEKPML